MPNVEAVARRAIVDPELVAALERADADGGGSWLVRFVAHAPAQGIPLLRMLDVVNGGDALPSRLRHLLRLLLAQMAGDPYTTSLNEQALQREGLDPGFLANLRWSYAESDLLEPRERLALRYAEQMFLDAKRNDDAVYDELREHFTEPEIMRIAVITGVNYAMSLLLRTTGATAQDDKR
jgi:alkylhydroperoxidase family enzyme